MDAILLPDGGLQGFWSTGRGAPEKPESVMPCPPASLKPCQSGFTFLQWQFRSSGGLFEADTVALHLREHFSQPISWLAGAIVRGEIAHFGWRSQLYVPMFQFALADMSPCRGLDAVLAELGPLDDWSRTTWFATPNSRLGGRRPADLISRQVWPVLEAAKARMDSLLTE